ncbi:MAG: fused MFS/spermidine synthase [Magnetococcales bacterium]|nr:fused MFS/spermidine synthase [Magnetococcales bacterium]
MDEASDSRGESPASAYDWGGQLPSSFKIISRRFWRGQTIDVVDEEGGTRALYFMSRLIQSRMDPKNPVRLVLPYSRHVMAALMFLADNVRPDILMIGLGGGSLAKFLLHHFPACSLDVVEVDEGMESLARKYFSLPIDTRLRVQVADGADYLQNSPNRLYDLILVDAFDRDGMARTVYARQFFLSAQRWLAPMGVIAVNMTKSDGLVYNTCAKQLKILFSNNLYRLPVRTSRNEILFCLPGFNLATDWIRVERQAKEMTQRTQLEFGQFLQDIRRFSSPFWNRGLHL